MWIQSMFLICQLAGLIMIVGAIWLIFREKIFVDTVTKQVMYIEMPLLGKVRTNAPGFALFVLGTAAVLYPPYLARTRYLKVHQFITSTNHPVVVYAVVRQEVRPDDGDVVLSVPILSDPDYDPQLVYVAGPITKAIAIDLSQEKSGTIYLKKQEVKDGVATTSADAIRPDLAPVPSEFK